MSYSVWGPDTGVQRPGQPAGSGEVGLRACSTLRGGQVSSCSVMKALWRHQMGIVLARGIHLVLAEGYPGCLSRKNHGASEGPEAGLRVLGMPSGVKGCQQWFELVLKTWLGF